MMRRNAPSGCIAEFPCSKKLLPPTPSFVTTFISFVAVASPYPHVVKYGWSLSWLDEDEEEGMEIHGRSKLRQQSECVADAPMILFRESIHTHTRIHVASTHTHTRKEGFCFFFVFFDGFRFVACPPSLLFRCCCCCVVVPFCRVPPSMTACAPTTETRTQEEWEILLMMKSCRNAHFMLVMQYDLHCGSCISLLQFPSPTSRLHTPLPNRACVVCYDVSLICLFFSCVGGLLRCRWDVSLVDEVATHVYYMMR